MTKNPFLNAFAAAAYIVFVVLAVNLGSKLGSGHKETIVVPMVMISVFTLSAAIMGYIFCLKPLQMYLDGEKREAIALFLKTVAAFAVFTILIAAIALIASRAA